MKEQQTVKKIKVDKSTGEVIIEERDFNFTKVWMSSFLTALEIVGNSKTKVACWVMRHLNRENLLPYTYRKIAQETGVSLDTVTKTMATLQEADFLRRSREHRGCYIVNPDILFKGSMGKRMSIRTEFNRERKAAERAAAKEKSLTPQERLEKLHEMIESLTAEADKLAGQLGEK